MCPHAHRQLSGSEHHAALMVYLKWWWKSTQFTSRFCMCVSQTAMMADLFAHSLGFDSHPIISSISLSALLTSPPPTCLPTLHLCRPSPSSSNIHRIFISFSWVPPSPVSEGRQPFVWRWLRASGAAAATHEAISSQAGGVRRPDWTPDAITTLSRLQLVVCLYAYKQRVLLFINLVSKERTHSW